MLNIAVTGTNLYVIGAVICTVCIFYTILVSRNIFWNVINHHQPPESRTHSKHIQFLLRQCFSKGGIKAVVHTDAWQIIVMFISVVVVTTMGTHAQGGLGEVFERAAAGGRLQFFKWVQILIESMRQITKQLLMIILLNSAWQRRCMSAIHFGVLWLEVSHTGRHSMRLIKRWYSVICLCRTWKKLDSACCVFFFLVEFNNCFKFINAFIADYRAIAIFTVGVVLFVSVCCYAGVLVYAEYWKCDPRTAKFVEVRTIYIWYTHIYIYNIS